MDMMGEFHAEVHRITKCPYTPSLKKLHNILQIADIDVLQLWARGNACQINSLATITLEALELWPFTLDIIKIMGVSRKFNQIQAAHQCLQAFIPFFRNAILQQKPVLLETFLKYAIESKAGFDRYAATCVALLSTPLELAIPSNAPVFYMKCLERAVRMLSSETIRPIYLLLSGLDSVYLDIMPCEILSSLQSQIIRVLSKLDSDDHLASLLCLAVLAKFSSMPGDLESSEPNFQCLPQDQIEPDSTDRFLPARKFFSSRVPKTLDLIVIKAITACSQRCKLKTHEICESLKLSRQIVDALDKKHKSHWQTGNVRKINKLYEKVLRSGIEAKVQCEALSLLVTLTAGESSHPEMGSTLQNYLLTSKIEILSANAIGQCIVLLEDASIRELLESLLVIACDKWQPCTEALTRIDHALQLISVLTEMVPTSSKLIKAVLQSVSSSVVSSMVHHDASQVHETMCLGSAYDHSTEEVCPSSYGEARARLHRNLSIMILKSVLHAPQCGSYFDASIMTLLLEDKCLGCSVQHGSVGCIQRRPLNTITPKISMFEAVSTPRMDSASLSWRDGLMKEMTRDIDCRYEGIIRMVGEICRDLELRCDENERPLREEQSTSHDLRAKLESRERDKAALEHRARDYESTISALEMERDCLANQVKATERNSKKLDTDLHDIHHEFDHAKTEAKSALQAAIESARQQDLVYLATMTGKDEVLEEQSLRLASTEHYAQTLEHELSRMRESEANNAERISDSETCIETMRTTISTLEHRIKDLQNELTQIKEQNAHNTAKVCNNMALIEELNNTVVALHEVSDQKGSSILALKDQLHKNGSVTSDLQLQHEMYVSTKDAEIKRLDESHRLSNDRWQRELEAARSGAAATSEQFVATIAGLKGKVESLQKERKEWAREFAEAQELSGRLVSLMATAKRPMSSLGPEPRINKPDLSCSDADIREMAATKPPRSSSSRVSSRAPKRIKRPQDPKTPTTCAAKLPRPFITSRERWRSATRNGRVPLTDLGSTQGQGPSTLKDRRHRGHRAADIDTADELLMENDEESRKVGSDEEPFGGGDIFTSTNQQHLSALQDLPRQHCYDETTTEF